jgi:hypothetical protein
MESKKQTAVEWFEHQLENIKARFLASRYDIYKEQIVEKGNDGYFIYNSKIYYGNRFGIFFYSNQNSDK